MINFILNLYIKYIEYGDWGFGIDNINNNVFNSNNNNYNYLRQKMLINEKSGKKQHINKYENIINNSINDY